MTTDNFVTNANKYFDHFLKHWRFYVGFFLFMVAELLLFGSAEGVQKWQSIAYTTIPNFLLTLGFVFL